MVKKNIPLIAVITVIAIAIIFKSNSYFMLLITIMGIYIIAVSGLDILFGYSGQISLGHAAFYAIGAYGSAILSKSLGLPVWITLFIGAVLAAIFGFIIALPAAKLVHHFLALLTIAAGQIVYIFIGNTEKLTGGFSGINRIPSPMIGSFKFKGNFIYFFLVLAFVILFLIAKQRIIDSRTGRAFIAIRENAHAANGIGINIVKYKVIAFVISAFFTGFAGGLYAHFIGFISPESFAYSQSVIFLTMLLFGGMGNMIGPIIGAVIIGLLQEYLQVLGNFQNIIYGFLIIVIILFLPKGFFGVLEIIKKFILRSISQRGGKKSANA